MNKVTKMEVAYQVALIVVNPSMLHKWSASLSWTKHSKTEKKKTGTARRQFTTTLVVPSSIVDNAQSLELKTYLVGQIAKAACLFCFTEIVVLSCDKTSQMKMMADLTTTEFFVKNLEYLETP